MILVQDRPQFDAAIKVLREARVIAMDTETTGFHVHMGNRLIGISTHCVMPGDTKYVVSFYFPFRHDMNEKQINLFTLSENLPVEWLQEFTPVFARDDLTLIFHHAKFDLKMLRADGFDIRHDSVKAIYDTMVMAQMCDENTSHKLDHLAARYNLDKGDDYKVKFRTLVKKAGGYHRTTPLQMGQYACDDAQNTYELAEILGNEMVTQDLMRLWKREMTFQFVLLEMEEFGIGVDVQLARKKQSETQARMRVLEDALGFDPGKRDALAHILHGDPAVGGLGLAYQLPPLKKDEKRKVSLEFPDGVPTMDEQALVKLKQPPRHPDVISLIDNVLEYRGLVKAYGTWYFGWTQKMSADQRIHPSYNTNPDSNKKDSYGTRTTRLSSSFPNIQQMPRDDEVGVKLLLKPPPGFVHVEFDYAQIEYREGACYANDPDLIYQFNNNIDTHQVFADEIGIDRQSAKQAVYTILFGGAGPTLARNIEKQVWLNEKKIIHFPDDRGTDIVNAYYGLHPKVREVAKLAEYNARRHGYVRLWTGRKRHFYAHEPWTHRKAFNSVLQGGAAEIIKDTMLQFYANGRKPYRMLIQVHDSLWFQIPDDDMFDTHVREIKDIMEWPGRKFPVPFPVDHKIIRKHELEAA